VFANDKIKPYKNDHACLLYFCLFVLSSAKAIEVGIKEILKYIDNNFSL
jgi:hypothetical protein